MFQLLPLCSCTLIAAALAAKGARIHHTGVKAITVKTIATQMLRHQKHSNTFPSGYAMGSSSLCFTPVSARNRIMTLKGPTSHMKRCVTRQVAAHSNTVRSQKSGLTISTC